MKKYLFIFVSLLSFLLPTNVIAQQKEATYIYRNDNAFNAFACSDIDSITYEGNGINATQVIWINENAKRIPVSVIDSVSFSVPQNVLLQIAEEDLNGWEIGYSLGDEYVVAYHEESDNTLVMMKNKNGAEAEEGLTLCFNEDGEIIRVGTLGKVYDVKYEDDNIILYRINEDGLYEEEVIPINQNAQSRRVLMRAISINDIIQLITNGINFVSNVAQGGTVATDVHNWKWDWDTVGDTGWLLIGIGTGGIPGAIITVGKEVFDHYNNQQNEQNRAVLYGDCTISIDEIRPDNANSVTYVYATVRNANTLPDYVFRVMYDHVCNEETRNLVSCGIVVRAHNEYVTAHINDYRSRTTQLNGDVKYGSEANLLFTIPGLDLTKNLSTYYFRPYLTSTRLETNYGDVKEGYIKYGETVPYTAFNGEIVEFKQYSADYSTDLDGYGFVHYFTTAHANITSLDNVEEWGVYILEEDGTYRYEPSEFKAAKLEDWITLYFNINKIDYDEINNDYFFASKKIKMGVYQKLKNPTGNYDYLSYFYSEPQEYELTYDEKPTAKTGDYVSVTSTSAVVKSKYEYCTFWNATCGIEYTNNDKTETLIVFPNNEDEQEINLTELTPNTTYKYRAFYEVKGKKEYGEYKSFKTEENLLCPDSNHPHWIDLGLPSGTLWRCCNEGASTPEAYGGYYQFGQVSSAPTLEQIKELVSNCTYQWTTQNGINGGKFTGPNGGSIFLPAAGYGWDGELYDVGSGGDYWSSTPNDEYVAFGLDFDGGYVIGYDWHDRYCGLSVRPVRK